MSPATENVNGKTEVSRKRKTSIDREDSLKKHDFREDETKSNQEEEKQADECRGGEEKQSKHKHRHHKHKHRSHRKHRHENRCEDQDARVKPKRMVVGEKMEDDREEGEILEEESPSAVSLKMGNRDAEKKNDRDKSRVAAVQVDGKAEVVFQSVLKIAEAYDSDERTSVEIIVPKANTGSPQEVVQSLPSEEDLNHSISREVALNERQRSRSQESVRDHRHMVKEEKKLKVDEQGHQSSSKAEDDDRHARNEGKHEIKTSSSSKDPSRDYKVDGTNADKVRHNDTDSIDKGHGRSRSPDKKDARGRERSRSRDRQRSKSRERQSRTRQPSRSRDRQRSRSRDRNSHCRQRSRSRDRRDYERSSRSRAYSPRRRRSRSRDSLLERRGDESFYLHGHRHEESREKSSRAGESRDKYDWATRADHRHTTNRDRNRERSGHVQERERDMRHHEYENNTNVFEDKARDEENQEEDYMERVASQLAEQEEDDVEKIKEESRKRRQAILEKYKQQHSNGQPDNGKKEVGDAIFFNETSAELERRPLDEGETAQLSLPLALGKLPLENGNSMVPRFRNSALGEGSPAKSEISGETFCDDIFGESPAGGHRAGKGDGITVETSDLIDNWDDHQGYYTYRLGEVLDLRYEIASSHGRGVFSSVVRARDSRASGDEPEEVAIKIIRNNETMYKAGQQELVILKKLAGADPENRRHCVRLLSSFEYRNHLCLVFESLHMNLREVLKKFGRNIGINMQAVRSYAKQLFIALKHLRNCGVLHCDIKPDNMLVNESKNVLKLCDFGSAMFAGENEITPYLVSRFYRAPEIMLGLPYDHALDMWSVGCCLYEFYTGKVLFPGKTNNDMLRLHMELKGPFPKKMLKRAAFAGQHFDQDYNFCAVEEDPVTKKVIKRVFNSVKPKDINALITGSGTAEEDQKMLNNFKHLMDKIFILDPEKRLTVSQALNHPFITGK